MLKPYFFIPSSNEHFLQNASNIESENLVFDFEDSIARSEFERAIELVSKMEISQHWTRPLLDISNGEINLTYMTKLIEMGFRKFVLPKIRDEFDLTRISNLIQSIEQNKQKFEFILLIENPYLLVKIDDIVEKARIHLVGLGLGSHDYAALTSMKHTFENLYYARSVILNVAKAYGLVPIDVASMNIRDDIAFQREIRNAIDLGFEGKFIIHPNQLNQLKDFMYFSDDEIQEAKKVYTKIKQLNVENFSLIEVEGKVYEKPHIERIIKIIKYSQKYGT